jgi:MarR family
MPRRRSPPTTCTTRSSFRQLGYSSLNMGRDELTPLFRSPAQGRILAVVLLARPEERLTISEIGRRADVPSSTTHREVDRLERFGLVTSERFAQARVVRPNESNPYLGDLRSLVLKAYGPAAVLGELLAPLASIDAAYVFGSWAARLGGEAGPPPGDVDLLVVGTPDPAALDAAMQEAEGTLGREVQPTVVAPGEWESGQSPLLRTIKERPLVPLALSRGA